YTFAVTGGSLPNGLTLSTAGVISGTSNTAGPYSFTVTATDSTAATGSRLYTGTIANIVLSLSPSTLTHATQGQVYSAQLTASGGNGAYTFDVSTGSLPSGVTLSTGGLLSATPTAQGSFPCPARAP